MGIGATIASRMHVGATNMEVIRYVNSRMKKSHRLNPDKKLRRERKIVYRDALKQHVKNRKLYLQIAKGIY